VQGDHDGLRTRSAGRCGRDESIGGSQLSPMVDPRVQSLESRSSGIMHRVGVRCRQTKRSTQEARAGRDQPGGKSDRKAADCRAPPGQHKHRHRHGHDLCQARLLREWSSRSPMNDPGRRWIILQPAPVRRSAGPEMAAGRGLGAGPQASVSAIPAACTKPSGVLKWPVPRRVNSPAAATRMRL
jgi:hypothetical protein